MSVSSDAKPVRWWPLYTIAALVSVTLLIIWIPDWSVLFLGQILSTVGISLIGSVLFLLWFFLFSRLSAKIRLRGLVFYVLLIGFMVSIFRISGLTGDMVPNVEWRWSSVSFLTTGQASGIINIDYPQFLGPKRNATLSGVELESDLVQHPPKLLWRIPVGEAWSAFAVVGRSAVTQEQQGEDETVVCYDLLTGEKKWRHKVKARYETPMAGIGPRATPTISENRVYTFGGTGILSCLVIRLKRRELALKNGV